jgi:class 3 adenylate cyclase
MSGTGKSDLGVQSRDRRKLVAIVHADMVGYSRLIGLDDQGTLERLRALRGDLIDPAIEEHGGKRRTRRQDRADRRRLPAHRFR